MYNAEELLKKNKELTQQVAQLQARLAEYETSFTQPQIIEGCLRIDSYSLAEGLAVSHEYVLQAIANNLSFVEDLYGQVYRAEANNVYWLTKQQVDCILVFISSPRTLAKQCIVESFDNIKILPLQDSPLIDWIKPKNLVLMRAKWNVLIDLESHESFMLTSNYAEVAGITSAAAIARLNRHDDRPKIPVPTRTGTRYTKVVDEQLIRLWLSVDNRELFQEAEAMGIRRFLHSMGNYFPNRVRSTQVLGNQVTYYLP